MKQILLADDEPMLLSSMVEIDWASIGVDHVYTASNGLETIAILENNFVDVVVTDIRMPGMSGLEICKYVREHFPRTKCILLSGYAEFKYAQEAVQHQTVDYLIKPVRDSDLIAVVGQTLDTAQKEWDFISSMERAKQSLKDNYPLLRSNLLNDLITGKPYSDTVFTEKMLVYELSFALGNPCYMFMIRMDQWYMESNEAELSLYEFSVNNIIDELMKEDFQLWCCKDALGYLVYMIKPVAKSQDIQKNDIMVEKNLHKMQSFIKTYLKGEVSVVISPNHQLVQEEIVSVYRLLNHQLRKLPRSNHGFFIQLTDNLAAHRVVSLQKLYQPPTFMQLLEAGRFSDAQTKLTDVFEELRLKKLDDEDHIMEVTSSLWSTFSYVAHLQGLSVAELVGDTIGIDLISALFKQPVDQILNWFRGMLDKLESMSIQETTDVYAKLMHKVNHFIEENISVDISLQAISDHVHLHPTYLSAMYKQHTGENISDYIYRYRMEQAVYLLRFTEIKIYELSQKLGFQNPPYFSKLFKNHYGLTPQEYREKFLTNR